MAWIKTIPFDEADDELKKILIKTRESYPKEYGSPNPPTIPLDESIVDSHTLIPQALYHSFTAFSAMMAPELPLSRRQHEMIATMVSLTNDCFY
jgi:hypothetical protein